MEYLDFGSSDSEQEDGMAYEMDSDEEEQYENKRLLKMFELHTPPSKDQRNIQDFEAEMEAELDRRALEIETQGGVEHQKSLSRSSSTNSLNKSPRASPVPGSSSSGSSKKSCLKRRRSHSRESRPEEAKSVKFALPSAPPGGEGELELTAMETTTSSTADAEKTQVSGTEKKAKEMYDELYFDSDESDGEENSEKRQKKDNNRRFMTDEELFYDPSSDAKDQAWIDNQRRKSHGKNNNTSSSTQTNPNSSHPSSSNSSKLVVEKLNDSSKNDSAAHLSASDAILNCPACFTTVCDDCQRHEVYVGQYRAMFVLNCLINTKETLTIPEKTPKKYSKRKKGKDVAGFTPCSSTDTFHPVNCKVCKTQVAMYDSDEIYHFFNVLASQP